MNVRQAVRRRVIFLPAHGRELCASKAEWTFEEVVCGELS